MSKIMAAGFLSFGHSDCPDEELRGGAQKLSFGLVSTLCFAVMGTLHFRALSLGLLIGASLCAFAETPPPVAPFETITWKAAMKRKPSMDLRMGAFRVRFEKTNLDDVRRAASVGEIAHQGDAGESVYWLCYTNLTSTAAERIWIVADGEMGGPEHYVTNIRAEVLQEGHASIDCPALPDDLKPLSLDNWLWLGSSEGVAFAKLGKPSYRKGAWHSYDFHGKVPGKCEGGGFDLVAGILLHIPKGRINALQVRQLTSC